MNTHYAADRKIDTETCIANLKMILENRSKIIKHVNKTIRDSEIAGYEDVWKYAMDNERVDVIDIPINRPTNQFYACIGVCGNAFLYRLPVFQEVTYKGSTITGVTYLCNKFRLLKDPQETSARTHSYPIDDSEVCAHTQWLNPERWELVEFCLKELDYSLEHGKVIGF